MVIDTKDNVKIDLSSGHKHALCPIKKGESVIKYGEVIGIATSDIDKGEWVHSHNLKTALSDDLKYEYVPDENLLQVGSTDRTFLGYRRKNGEVGIRNDVWIITTVGCIADVAKSIAERTGAIALSHPYGCSQLGEDQLTTEKTIAALALHPNAGGVLVLGLGCENNSIERMIPLLGDYDKERIRFLLCQESEDEVEDGAAVVRELQAIASTDKRVPVSISELKIGLKCGGSDGYSGISANPLLGRLTDRMTSLGAKSVLTEVPEMFGAEHLLMKRCASKEIFEKTVKLINDFKDYYRRHGQPIYENPSPGNKAGGITTLEEKSLGCIRKGGKSPVTDVLDYGEKVTRGGLSLLNGPGNDLVSLTNLAAAGAHLVLFTTGRGTPFGGAVPTIKVATNAELAKRKSGWIDFDSSPTLAGEDMTEELFDYVIRVAEGEPTCNEKKGYRSIAVFKSGVTL